MPSVVGLDEVVEVRAATAAFAGLDNRYGGGFVREAVTAQLRYCAELLGARCSEPVRAELFSSVGYLGQVAGFMAFDDYAHDDARRMFHFALSCAEDVEDWHLRATVLNFLAAQAIWCGDSDEALTFVELALVRAGRLTATERAMLHTTCAHALAKLGRVQEAMAAVGVADEEFSHAHPEGDPMWMRGHYDPARHCGGTGRALWHLGVHDEFVSEVRNRLEVAVAGHGEGFVRARARGQIKLASLVMATSDPYEAAALGGQALDAMGTLCSRRAADDLRELRRLGQPHQGLTEV
ncbi:MAG: XRE family transcriptional regulator [Sciscionella sp.]